MPQLIFPSSRMTQIQPAQKKHQDRQTKGHYKVLQGALQSPQCVSVDAVGFWGASEKGLPALGWEKGHELHLSADVGEIHTFRRLI